MTQLQKAVIAGVSVEASDEKMYLLNMTTSSA